MRKIALTPLFLLIVLTCFADKDNKKKAKTNKAVDSLVLLQQAYLKFADSVNAAMKYQTGTVALGEANATLNIAPGFKFLNAEQSKFVWHKVWGNPERADVLGMIMPEFNTPFTDTSYAFVVSYDDMGYVKDDDAKDEDYGKIMKDWKDQEPEINKDRTAQGYPAMYFKGWAQQPFYDDKHKVIHWAKNLKFGDDSLNTLNYEVRVLGRKGVLSLTAVATMDELPQVNKDIQKVLDMAAFDAGNRYADFNSGTDKIAAYTVGALVAGSILTKVGFWAVIAKFMKLIIAGLIAAFYGVRKWLTGKRRKELAPETIDTDNDQTA